MKKECGIYSITNIKNGKLYIGSSCDIQRRWKEHKKNLNNNTHHSYHLQQAWNLYGEDSFIFDIVEYCESEILIQREQYYLDLYQSYNRDKGYNIAISSCNHAISQEVRDRISNTLTGKYIGENCFYSKYTEEQIKEVINDLYKNKLSYKEIAQKNNVSISVVGNIKHGNSWNYLTQNIYLPKRIGKHSLLNENDVIEIIQLLLSGKKNNEIAKMFNVAPHTISDIRLHKTWTDLTKEIDFPKASKARYGKNNNMSKLSINEVLEIKKALLNKNVNLTALGRKFNVSCQAIINIRDGKAYRDVCLG